MEKKGFGREQDEFFWENVYFFERAINFLGAEAQRQIDQLKVAVDALENEKADMIQKLSEAKQQGVNAVRCEEEEKRQKLKTEMERKWSFEKEQDERLFQEMIMKNVRSSFH